MKVRVSTVILLGFVATLAFWFCRTRSNTSESQFRTIVIKHSDLRIAVAAQNEPEVLGRRNVLLVPSAALQFRPRSDQVVAPPPQLVVKENIFGDRLTDEILPLSDGVGNSSEPAENASRNPPGTALAQDSIDTLWVIDTSRRHVYPISVVVHFTDGVYTEIVSKDLREGNEIVTSVANIPGSHVTSDPRKRECDLRIK